MSEKKSILQKLSEDYTIFKADLGDEGTKTYVFYAGTLTEDEAQTILDAYLLMYEKDLVDCSFVDYLDNHEIEYSVID